MAASRRLAGESAVSRAGAATNWLFSRRNATRNGAAEEAGSNAQTWARPGVAGSSRVNATRVPPPASIATTSSNPPSEPVVAVAVICRDETLAGFAGSVVSSNSSQAPAVAAGLAITYKRLPTAAIARGSKNPLWLSDEVTGCVPTAVPSIRQRRDPAPSVPTAYTTSPTAACIEKSNRADEAAVTAEE